MATKTKVAVPPIVKVGGSEEVAAVKTPTKRSEISYRSSKEAETLIQVLSKTEETIQELTRMLAESEDSKHLGVGGMPKITPKQLAIQKELDEARARYKEVMRLIGLSR